MLRSALPHQVGVPTAWTAVRHPATAAHCDGLRVEPEERRNLTEQHCDRMFQLRTLQANGRELSARSGGACRPDRHPWPRRSLLDNDCASIRARGRTPSSYRRAVESSYRRHAARRNLSRAPPAKKIDCREVGNPCRASRSAREVLRKRPKRSISHVKSAAATCLSRIDPAAACGALANLASSPARALLSTVGKRLERADRQTARLLEAGHGSAQIRIRLATPVRDHSAAAPKRPPTRDHGARIRWCGGHPPTRLLVARHLRRRRLLILRRERAGADEHS